MKLVLRSGFDCVCTCVCAGILLVRPASPLLALVVVALALVLARRAHSRFDLSLEVSAVAVLGVEGEGGCCLEGAIEFNTDLFERDSKERLWRQKAGVLRRQCANVLHRQ